MHVLANAMFAFIRWLTFVSLFITRSYTPCAYMLSMYCARGVCLLKSIPLKVDMHLVHNIGYRISLAAARSFKRDTSILVSILAQGPEPICATRSRAALVQHRSVRLRPKCGG